MKLPVAIKTIHDRMGRQTFNGLTDVRKHCLKENCSLPVCLKVDFEMFQLKLFLQHDPFYFSGADMYTEYDE